jgi:hypothetical protein
MFRIGVVSALMAGAAIGSEATENASVLPDSAQVENVGASQQREQFRRIHRQCLTAVGHEGFCTCLTKNMPEFAADADFIFYTVVVNATKEELKYEEMSDLQRRVYDQTLETREYCVQNSFAERETEER